MSPGPAFTSETGRAAQRVGAQVRTLTLATVEECLPALDTPEHIRANCELVQRWALAGLVPGTVANACVQAANAALRLYEAELDRARVKALEQRVKDLERELAKRPAAVRRA